MTTEVPDGGGGGPSSDPRKGPSSKRRKRPTESPSSEQLLNDMGPVRTRSMAKRAKRLQELQSRQETNPCSICLSEPEDDNVSFAKTCFHRFCYGCLKEWAKVNNICPLCKVVFQTIVRRGRTDDGVEHYEECPVPIRPRPVSPFDVMQILRRSPPYSSSTSFDRLFGGVLVPDVMAADAFTFQLRPTVVSQVRANAAVQTIQVQRLQDIALGQSHRGPTNTNTQGQPTPSATVTTSSASTQLIGSSTTASDDATQRALPVVPPLERQRRERVKRARADAFAARHRVYGLGLYAEPSDVSVARDTAPSHYRENPAAKERIKTFLDREFVVMFPDDRVAAYRQFGVERVVTLLDECHILSPEFRECMQLHVPVAHVDHFIHELYSFAVSPAASLADYDRTTTYTADSAAVTNSRDASSADASRPSCILPNPGVAGTSVTSLCANGDGLLPSVNMFERLSDIPGPSTRPDLASWILDSPEPPESSGAGGRTSPLVVDEVFDGIERSRNSSGTGSTGFQVGDDDGEVEIVEELPPKHLRTPEMIDIASDDEESSKGIGEEPGTSVSSGSGWRGKGLLRDEPSRTKNNRSDPPAQIASQGPEAPPQMVEDAQAKASRSSSAPARTFQEHGHALSNNPDQASFSAVLAAAGDGGDPGDSEIEIVEEVQRIFRDNGPLRRSSGFSVAKRKRRSLLRVMTDCRQSLKSSSESDLDEGTDDERRRRRVARVKRRRVSSRRRERRQDAAVDFEASRDFSIARILRSKGDTRRAIEDGFEGDNEAEDEEVQDMSGNRGLLRPSGLPAEQVSRMDTRSHSRHLG